VDDHTGHDVAYGERSERPPQYGLLITAFGGLAEEQSDQHEPQPAHELSREGAKGPDAHQDERERRAHSARHPRRLLEIPLPLPERGAQESPPIERKPGDEVEDAHQDIDGRQVPHDGPCARWDVEECRPQGEERRDREARYRADNGDDELGPWPVRLALELRHPSENVQRDPRHRDPVAARRHRVGELVQEHRGEQQERGQEPPGPMAGERDVGQHVGEIADREAPREQSEDGQPAHVGSHRDPEDPEQRRRTAHQRILLLQSLPGAADGDFRPSRTSRCLLRAGTPC
jgi:hypothetical protein